MPFPYTPSAPETFSGGDGQIPATKPEMRRFMKRRLAKLSYQERVGASIRISLHATQVVEFSRAQTLAFFTPFPSEPDLTVLIAKATAQRKRILLPRVISSSGEDIRQGGVISFAANAHHYELEWRAVPAYHSLSACLIPGPFPEITEPNPDLCPPVPASEIDCAFIPGLGFDSKGHRLGRGGGFYDRFISESSRGPRPAPHFFGVMFDCQKLDSIPTEAHDQPLRCVITESGMQHFP